MGLLASQPVVLPYQELPGAVSARELAEHYKLYLGYREQVQRVGQGLLTAPRPTKSQYESPYSGLLWGQGFALAGAHLHELYFENLTRLTIRPLILLGIDKACEIRWGSQEAFRKEFVAAGLEARGWVVLAVAYNDVSDLRIFALDAHDLGAVYGYCPLLVIDTYEHAYWMDFGTDKGSYLSRVMGYVDWNVVEGRFKTVHPGGPIVAPPVVAYSYDRS
jgi:Fe-Mn family superoxide dismutase